MNLALFDLDHTLIPFDSGMAWTGFLVARGALPASAEAAHLAYCRQYVAGTLDIRAMHRASVAPLARFEPEKLAQWGDEFEAAMAARVPATRRRWVRAHADAGDLCAIVTATSRFIAEPFGRLFGVDHVVATEAVREHGRMTGEIDGEPCFREHKLTHVERWLGRLGTSLGAFGTTWFYSDSSSDLPLLRAVSNPVAVAPDARLRAEALAAGWPVIEAGGEGG